MFIFVYCCRGLSIHPFCNKVKRDPLQTECTDDRTSVALCNLVRHDYLLPELYQVIHCWKFKSLLKCLYSQNFDAIQHVEPGTEGYYGGSVSLADYCPYIQEFTWRSNNVIVRGSHCQYADNNPRKCVCLPRTRHRLVCDILLQVPKKISH